MPVLLEPRDLLNAVIRLPEYGALPADETGERTGWFQFGFDDNVGLINLQTPERIAAAAKLVKRGAAFRLDAPIDFLSYELSGRGTPRHRIAAVSDVEFDDWIDGYYLQVSSQWDALGHFGCEPDTFYNGARGSDIARGRRNTIEHWAKRGIVGRGILLDVARALREQGREFSPGEAYAITAGDLELTRKRARVRYEPGDIIIVRTGWMGWYEGLADSARRAHAAIDDPPTAGLEVSNEMAQYVWNSHGSALVSDNIAVEVRGCRPRDGRQADFLHRTFIGRFGLALGELWWLEELADDCAEDGVYEVFIASCPLFVNGGIGSPANALACK